MTFGPVLAYIFTLVFLNAAITTHFKLVRSVHTNNRQSRLPEKVMHIFHVLRSTSKANTKEDMLITKNIELNLVNLHGEIIYIKSLCMAPVIRASV